MRLAINAMGLAPGGGLTGLLGYLKAWQELDLPLEITLFASRPAVLDAVHACRPDANIQSLMVNESRAKRFLYQKYRLGKHIKRARADVVMTTNRMVGRCEVPQLVHFRNLWNFTFPTLWRSWRTRGFAFMVRDWSVRRTLQHSICNAYISDYLRRAAERFVPASAPYNHVVHNGLAEDIIQSARTIETLWSGKPTIAAIQGASDQKDNATLLRMVAELVRLRPGADWRLRIAGDGDWTKYRRLAEELGVRERIDWLGFQNFDQTKQLLRESLCFVFTSVLEGFGNPPLEAMAQKCPVVASNTTAMPEVIGNGGMLVPPSQPTAFAEAVIRIAEDTKHREDMIEQGLCRIQQFRWTDSAARMLALFESIAR